MPTPLRRLPKQARARDTQAAIFEATAQILESRGEAALTTNSIAERAGISVGTLYQYFANKRSILVAMAHAENAAVRTKIGAEAGANGLSSIRLAIRTQIAVLANRPATRRAVLRAILEAESLEDISSETRVTNRLIDTPGDMSRLDYFILTRAVIGVIRSAVLEASPHLMDPNFEDALVRLVERYASA